MSRLDRLLTVGGYIALAVSISLILYFFSGARL